MLKLTTQRLRMAALTIALPVSSWAQLASEEVRDNLRTGHESTCVPSVETAVAEQGIRLDPEHAKRYCQCLGELYFDELSADEWAYIRANPGAMPPRIMERQPDYRGRCAARHIPALMDVAAEALRVLTGQAEETGSGQTDAETPYITRNWQLTGEARTCQISTHHTVPSLTLAIDETTLTIGLRDTSWQLPEGATYPQTQLWIDRHQVPLRTPFAADSPDTIKATADPAVAERVSSGTRLRVIAPQATFYVDLTGSAAAIAQLRECAGVTAPRSGQAAAPRRPEPQVAPAPDMAPAELDAPPQQMAEQLPLKVLGLLKFANIEKPQVTTEPIWKQLKPSYGWRGRWGMEGNWAEFDATASDTAFKLLGIMLGSCPAEFSRAYQPRQEVRGAVVTPLVTRCESGGRMLWQASATLLEREGRTSAVIHRTTDPEIALHVLNENVIAYWERYGFDRPELD